MHLLLTNRTEVRLRLTLRWNRKDKLVPRTKSFTHVMQLHSFRALVNQLVSHLLQGINGTLCPQYTRSLNKEKKKLIPVWGHRLCGFPLRTLGSPTSQRCTFEVNCRVYVVPVWLSVGVWESAPCDGRGSWPRWVLFCDLTAGICSSHWPPATLNWNQQVRRELPYFAGYNVLPYIMHSLVFGPNFQEKKSFILIF